MVKRTDQREKFDREAAEDKKRKSGKKDPANDLPPEAVSTRGRGGRGRGRPPASDEPAAGRGRGRGRGRGSAKDRENEPPAKKPRKAESPIRGSAKDRKNEPPAKKPRKAESPIREAESPMREPSEGDDSNDDMDSPHGKQTVCYSPAPAGKQASKPGAKAPKKSKEPSAKAKAKATAKGKARQPKDALIDDAGRSPPRRAGKKTDPNASPMEAKATGKLSPGTKGQETDKVSPSTKARETVEVSGKRGTRKTFASRRPPQGENALDRFETIKNVFQQQVAPKFDCPSSWEVLGFCKFN